MNPYGLFQGFGQMSRGDFKAPARGSKPGPPAPSPAASPYGSSRGNGNNNPYGTAGNRGLPATANIPAQYPEGVPGRQAAFPAMKQADFAGPLGVMTSQNFGGGGGMQRADFAPATLGAVTRPAETRSSRPPVTQRPAAITVPGGTIEADYRVPAGQAPMPSVAPQLPAGTSAARAGAMMTPVGSGRNEQLVQTAGNAGVRLTSPEAMAIVSAQPMRPMVSNDGARRMLSEFDSARPALMSEMSISPAAFNPAGPLSPAALQASGAGFLAAAAASGDRFSHLRPDIAEWARHHENSAKGVDGMNIVDRFMAKQGAAPPAAPVSFPAQAPAGAVAVFNPSVIEDYAQPGSSPNFDGPTLDSQNPGLMGRIGAALQPAAVDPAALQQAFQPNPLQSAASVFGSQEVNPVDQVGIIREMYRQRTRPQPAPF